MFNWSWVCSIRIAWFSSLHFLFLICIPPVLSVHYMEPAEEFCYDDPACDEGTWGGLCNIGNHQSPINIQLDSFHARLAATPTRFDLNYPYAHEIADRFYAQNLGHTVHFALTPNATDLTSDLILSDGDLNGLYRFAEFHFHWGERDFQGSEHQVNGKKYELEMHLVHHHERYRNVAEAMESNDPEALAVMAVLYKVGLIPNNDLVPIIHALDELQEPGDVLEFNVPLRILELYPQRLEFARYSGSVTTPSCDETVVWTVFHRPEKISEDQLEAFRRLRNKEGRSFNSNYRSVQPLNQRTIQFYHAKSFRSSSNDIVDFDRILTFLIQCLVSFGRELVQMLRMPYLIII